MILHVQPEIPDFDGSTDESLVFLDSSPSEFCGSMYGHKFWGRYGYQGGVTGWDVQFLDLDLDDGGVDPDITREKVIDILEGIAERYLPMLLEESGADDDATQTL